MLNLLSGLKIFIISVITSVTAVVSPTLPIYTPNPTPIVLPQTVPNPTPAPTPISSPSPNPSSAGSSPLPLNGENYIYVQGTYSYVGQAVKYLFLVPKMGGSFSGAISGACQAQAGGDYEGGNGGKIFGNVGGSCNMFGIQVKGSTKFNGRLYPDTKTIEFDIDNSPIHGFKINYN